MFKDKTFKCRVCDSCDKIVGIQGLEDFPDEELYKVKNLETGSVDEICGDCMDNRTFTCCGCGDSFYNTNKFVYNRFYYCPKCAEERANFNFIEKIKNWKKEWDEAENNEN